MMLVLLSWEKLLPVGLLLLQGQEPSAWRHCQAEWQALQARRCGRAGGLLYCLLLQHLLHWHPAAQYDLHHHHHLTRTAGPPASRGCG